MIKYIIYIFIINNILLLVNCKNDILISVDKNGSWSTCDWSNISNPKFSLIGSMPKLGSFELSGSNYIPTNNMQMIASVLVPTATPSIWFAQANIKGMNQNLLKVCGAYNYTSKSFQFIDNPILDNVNPENYLYIPSLNSLILRNGNNIYNSTDIFAIELNFDPNVKKCLFCPPYACSISKLFSFDEERYSYYRPLHYDNYTNTIWAMNQDKMYIYDIKSKIVNSFTINSTEYFAGHCQDLYHIDIEDGYTTIYCIDKYTDGALNYTFSKWMIPYGETPKLNHIKYVNYFPQDSVVANGWTVQYLCCGVQLASTTFRRDNLLFLGMSNKRGSYQLGYMVGLDINTGHLLLDDHGKKENGKVVYLNLANSTRSLFSV